MRAPRAKAAARTPNPRARSARKKEEQLGTLATSHPRTKSKRCHGRNFRDESTAMQLGIPQSSCEAKTTGLPPRASLHDTPSRTQRFADAQHTYPLVQGHSRPSSEISGAHPTPQGYGHHRGEERSRGLCLLQTRLGIDHWGAFQKDFAYPKATPRPDTEADTPRASGQSKVTIPADSTAPPPISDAVPICSYT